MATHIEPKGGAGASPRLGAAARTMVDVCLAASGDAETVARVLLDRGAALVGARSGEVYLRDGARLRQVASLRAGDAEARASSAVWGASKLAAEAAEVGSPVAAAQGGERGIAVPVVDPSAGVIGVIELRGGDGSRFGQDDTSRLRALALVGAVAARNAQLRQELDRAHLDVIFRLSTAAEFRDHETGGHIQRVSMYAEMIASKMGLPRELCRRLLFAAPMHDVGKLGVPDAILRKAGPLTEDERDEMRRHTTIGADILGVSADPVVVMAREIALAHHERWDGSGYPKGLAGSDIPIAARIVAVADVFDALTSARVYKPAMAFEEAMTLIEGQSGRHFDPAVARAFLESAETVAQIASVFGEAEAVAASVK